MLRGFSRGPKYESYKGGDTSSNTNIKRSVGARASCPFPETSAVSGTLLASDHHEYSLLAGANPLEWEANSFSA
jgi:hypothetical protein